MSYCECNGDGNNIADQNAQALHCGLHAIAEAIRFGAKEIGKEGAGGMGALEGLALKIEGGLSSISDSLSAIDIEHIKSRGV